MHVKRALNRFDHVVATAMERYGHLLHRITLGLVFIWFGTLKLVGVSTATSIIAHTVFIGSPQTTVPILGLWEAVIGVCLIVRPLVRVAILLLAVRLVGTLLALVIMREACFQSTPWAPTIEGQFLIKDLMLFGAAMVIGGTVRAQPPAGVRH